MKSGPNLNLIKKWGNSNCEHSKVNFDKEAKSDKKNLGKMGGWGRALNPKQYARLCQMR